ncbi:hypothetical protein ACFWNN_20695 [Lentzea sp. NPDC058450]|uniref:hypothetical protein n=1 Tax=Lentzea sp. NPDC058450 TaxID=3346505 RepID=UPI003665FFF8
MIKALLCTAVAGVVAFSGASVANAAEPAPIDIRMILGDSPMAYEYVDVGGTHWTSRRGFDFSVRLTDIGDENEQGVTVFLSVPDELDVQARGDGWTCGDTEGGIDCRHSDLVVPGEAWPDLHFRAQPLDYVRDTIDVYATTGDYAASHEGVTYHLDASV